MPWSETTVMLMVAGRSPATLDGLIWRGDDGAVRDSLGTQVSQFSQPEGSDLPEIYAAVQLDTIGMRGASIGSESRLSEIGPDLMALSNEATHDAGTPVHRSLFLLPAGDYGDGPRAEVVTSDGASDLAVMTGRLTGGELDGRYVVAVRYTGEADSTT